MEVPRSYSHPYGPTVELAVARLPAQDEDARIGSLFVNFGGPGGDAAATIKAIGAADGLRLAQRPLRHRRLRPARHGESEDAIDCRVNQETARRLPPAVPHAREPGRGRVGRRQPPLRAAAACGSTTGATSLTRPPANAARDMNFLRAAVGDRKLSYLGFSYGTAHRRHLREPVPEPPPGARARRALDADKYLNKPLLALREQTSAFERALGRYLPGLRRRPGGLPGLRRRRPLDGVRRAGRHARRESPASLGRPTRAGGRRRRPGGRVDQPLRQAGLAVPRPRALAAAEAGDYSLIRQEVDFFYGLLRTAATTRSPTATSRSARSSSATRATCSPTSRPASTRGTCSTTSGGTAATSSCPGACSRSSRRGAYYGPVREPALAPTTLVVGTTYDPATPYRGGTEARRRPRQRTPADDAR